MALFSPTSKSSDDTHHLADVNRLVDKILRAQEAYENIDERNPFIHD